MEFDNSIVDGENFKYSDTFGFREIVLRQLQKVITNMSQEMRSGFWLYSSGNINMTSQKTRYVGDSRKELRASIDTLHDILQPKFDKPMKEKSEKAYSTYSELVSDSKPNQEESLWIEALKIYRELFQAICFFLERIGWLESPGVEE